MVYVKNQMEICKPQPLPLKDLDWGSLVPWIGSAREALARFDEHVRKIPSAQLDILKWEESIASLRGQNIKTSLEEVLKFNIEKAAEENRTPILKKIISTKKGLDFAIRWAKKNPLNIQFFCKLHAIIKQDGPNPKEIGRIRQKQNWIGPLGGSIDEGYFFPPEAKKIVPYLNSLNRYYRKKEKDPLVQIAIYFAQFLIIHPFMDGNGRVARIFIPVALKKKGLLSKPFLFLSDYFETHRLQYVQKLFYISEKGAWEDWIIFFLQGVIVSSLAFLRKCRISSF